jgi:hypothetical protein
MRSAHLRKSVAFISTLGMILALLSVGVFTEPVRAATATISGTVTIEDGGTPMEECPVALYPAEWECAHEFPLEIDSTLTDEFGAYTFTDLEAGNYKVLFNPDDGLHLHEWYDGSTEWKPEWEGADWIPVAEDEDVTGIDADLTPSGSISGKVTSEDGGTAILGCTVTVYEKEGDSYFEAGSTTTDDLGDYMVGMLFTGEFVVQFDPGDEEHLAQWYDGKRRKSNATVVNVVSGVETPDIDAVLWVGAVISGTVTMEYDDQPVNNCNVEAVDADTGTPVTSTSTDEDGDYSLKPLWGGNYKVHFMPGGLKKEQWYSLKSKIDDAETLELDRGDAIASINGELSLGDVNRYAVTPATFDDLGSIAGSLGILTENIEIYDGGTSADEDLGNPYLLSKFDSVLVNCASCAAFEDLGGLPVLKQFVEDGGSVFLSCCSGYQVIETAFPGHVDFPGYYPCQGLMQEVRSDVHDTELAMLIGERPNTLFERSGFPVVTDVSAGVDVYMTATVESDHMGTMEDMPVYMSFPYGDGEVFFCAFHCWTQEEVTRKGILSHFFAIAAEPPAVTGIKPNKGPVGTQVTISGRHFGPERLPGCFVTFDGKKADRNNYIFWSDDQLVMTVPGWAKTGPVQVTNLAGESNTMKFTVTTEPGPVPPVPPGPAVEWYLAEGSTGADGSGSFETWVLVQNPGGADTTVNLTYMTDEGVTPGPEFPLEANSRTSINVADTLPDTWSVSTRVTSVEPVIAERSVYWNAPGVERRAAHDSIGVTSPATEWYLAEGSTGADGSGSFETWVLVQNPGEEDANVTLAYMTEEAEIPGPEFKLEKNTRMSFNVADTVPNTWSVSTKVTSDKPVIAERSAYWNAPGVPRQAAHDSIGVTAPDTTWYLAEGSTGAGDAGSFETWVLVQNPGEEDTTAYITYMTDEGTVSGPKEIIKGNSRMSFNVADTLPDTWSVSTKVTSDKPVIAERSVYWNAPGVPRQAAHDSIGVTSPAAEWYLAEGSTGSGESGSFETWILVQNPGGEDATVNLTYMTEDGTVPGPRFDLKANSRSSFNVADTLPDTWSISTRVTSDKPVIAERSVYWNAPGVERQAAHDSIGVPGE